MRRRLAAARDEARRAAEARRERSSEAQRAYAVFLEGIAVPVGRMVAMALKADGYPFTVATPGDGLRLTWDRGREDSIEIALDTAADPPEVVGRTSYARGSRTVTEERAVKPGAPPESITEEDFLEFLVQALEPWLQR
ncbi:MAG: hypothetical protein ACRD26_22365 [Vicinamibacterales bacterium]